MYNQPEPVSSMAYSTGGPHHEPNTLKSRSFLPFKGPNTNEEGLTPQRLTKYLGENLGRGQFSNYIMYFFFCTDATSFVSPEYSDGVPARALVVLWHLAYSSSI